MDKPFAAPIHWCTLADLPRASGMATHVSALLTALHAEGIRIEGRSVPRLLTLTKAEALAQRLVRQWRGPARPAGLHIDLNGLSGRALLAAAQAAEIPATVSYHALHLQGGTHGDAIRAMEFEWLRQAGAVVALAADQAADLAAAGIRVVSIPHGIDLRGFTPARRDTALRQHWGASELTPVLAWCGRLSPEKDPWTFVAAAEAARSADPTLVAVIIGDGPLAAEFRQRLPWGHFLSSQPLTEVGRLLANCDLLCFPSRVETWGLVVAEAMASGIAVVARNRAAAAEQVRPGIDGLITDLADDQALISATVALVTDLPRARQLGAHARTRIATWDWPLIASRWVELWHRQGILPSG